MQSLMMQGIRDFLQLIGHRMFFSDKKLKNYQEHQLLYFVEKMTRVSPYYRESLKDLKFSTLNDFKKVPIINKQIMMDHFDELNTCGLNLAVVKEYAVEKELNKDYYGYYQNKYVVGLSSGTSGNKGIYITPKALTERLPFVFLARSGIPISLLPYRILFLLRVFSQGFQDINAPFVKLNYLSTMEPIHRIIEAINQNQINILMAPPSLIRLLIPYKEKLIKPPKMIVCYAEVLEAEEKQRFCTLFQTKVIEIYQASEGQMGSACRCGNLHINEDLVYVELFDALGNEVTEPDVVATRMIVTNLVNEAQPLIRYEMNDMVVLGKKCPCGSSFRVIKKVLGRNDDVIYLDNRKNEKQHVFPDLISRWIITSSDLIREFKVVQTKDTTTDGSSELSSGDFSGQTLQITLDLLEKNKDESKQRVDELEQSKDEIEQNRHTSTESFENQVAKSVKQRLIKELSDLQIDANIQIVIEKIVLPQNMSKYKRFVARKS
jgi:putative adenylate-forming enzyme